MTRTHVLALFKGVWVVPMCMVLQAHSQQHPVLSAVVENWSSIAPFCRSYDPGTLICISRLPQLDTTVILSSDTIRLRTFPTRDQAVNHLSKNRQSLRRVVVCDMLDLLWKEQSVYLSLKGKLIDLRKSGKSDFFSELVFDMAYPLCP